MTGTGVIAAAGRAPARAMGLAPLVAAVTIALLCAAAAVAADDAAAKPRKAKLDLRLERTPIIVADAYSRLPEMGRRGAMGGNLRGSGFDVADQQLGDLYVRAGLAFRNKKLIKRGFRAFDFAFHHQRRDGGFNESQTEAYAFFVEAVAHSALLVRASPYGRDFGRKLRRYERRLGRAARHMVARRMWAGFRSRNSSYTHAGYSTGAALGLTGKLSRSGRLMRFGRSAVRHSLDNQRSSGVNPELGAFDVRYQMAGLLYAERYRIYFPGGGLARRMERMIGRGLRWMNRRVMANGYIKWRGSSRTCRELNSLGNPKTPGYAFAVRGYAYWGAYKGQGGLLERARRIDRYASATGGSPCGPMRRITGAERQAADASRHKAAGEGPVGTLSRRQTNDLLE
jgi:hypothetical protein